MIVVDSNIVSEAMRPSPDPAVLAWLNLQARGTLFLSSVSLGEILYGIGALPMGRRSDAIEAAFETLRSVFATDVLSFDENAARAFVDMALRARDAGRPLPVNDGYLAATAASRGFAVATRNTRHFVDTGVEVIDPFQGT